MNEIPNRLGKALVAQPSADAETLAAAWDAGFEAAHRWWCDGIEGGALERPANPHRAALNAR